MRAGKKGKDMKMPEPFDPYSATSDECRTYLEERMRIAHGPYEDGFFILGGIEVMLLWDSVALSFTTRNWIGAVLGAQAMCERGLAEIYSMPYSPRQDPERAALGTLLRWAREDGFIPSPVLEQVQTLCDRRKVLTHWKLPTDPGTIMRRSIEGPVREDLEFPERQQHLLAEDAKLAVDAVFAFCFGNQMDMIPRHPGISAQSLGSNVATTREA